MGAEITQEDVQQYIGQLILLRAFTGAGFTTPGLVPATLEQVRALSEEEQLVLKNMSAPANRRVRLSRPYIGHLADTGMGPHLIDLQPTSSRQPTYRTYIGVYTPRSPNPMSTHEHRIPTLNRFWLL